MKLWGGRYEVETDALMHALNRSLPFDQRLWRADIEGSRAWAQGLHEAGLIDAQAWQALDSGLAQIAGEWEAGTFVALPGDEDIHSAVERRLFELVGEVAGRLHTGRSRNDQIATDMRLGLRWESEAIEALLVRLQGSLVAHAAAYPELILPGYTHLQPAQPILYAHWVLRHFWPLQRDRERLAQARQRMAVLPLGSGALAGHSLGVDRRALAERLGFHDVSQNSLDGVADRDFVAEFLAVAALIGTHLSQLAEDLILYANPSLGFVRLDPRFTTGSSLMPQKANPDALELARGKAGRLMGNLIGVLVMLKGLPTSYNKDLQEDKEPLWDTLDTLAALLPVLADLVATMTPQPNAMGRALDAAMLATDLADYLVKRGVPFRSAHHLAGRAVAAAEARGVALGALPLDAFQEISPHFQADLYHLFDWSQAVAAKNSIGSTGHEAVMAQLQQARALLEA